MKTQQKTIRMNHSEIQRFEHILKVRLEQTIRSLDRLHDETRSIDSDSPSDSADQCVLSPSREALFHQSGERRVMFDELKPLSAESRKIVSEFVLAAATVSIPVGLRLSLGRSTVLTARRIWSVTRH